jgi:hypothetical protein
VAEALPLSEGELRLLASLVRHRVQFMVVGLSAAALQGAPVVTEDVDLWFENLNDPCFNRALKAVGAAYVPPFGLNPPMLAGLFSEPFDIVLRMDGLGTFEHEAQNARKIRVGPVLLKVLPLDRILASKAAADRQKDKLTIQVLQNALHAVQSTTPKKNRGTKKKPKNQS